MKPRLNLGMTLMEAIIALGVIGAAAAIAFTVAKVGEDKASALAKMDFVTKLVRTVHETYGVMGPYPAGTMMPTHLVTLPGLPKTAYSAGTGCFSLDPLMDLCVNVIDDGVSLGTSTGYGAFWDVTMVTRAGGAAAKGCVQVAAAARTYMIDAGVGTDKPRDAGGQWLQGEPWDDWWRARCNQPLTATFRMR